MATTSVRPVVREDQDIGTGEGDGHTVFLFNCECHSFEEVIAQLCKAVPGMTVPAAEEIAWRVHTQGLAEVYKGSQGECDRVARIIGEIGLIVQVH
jgi:ATP-dependent Clp protease adaptor protein ClpS